MAVDLNYLKTPDRFGNNLFALHQEALQLSLPGMTQLEREKDIYLPGNAAERALLPDEEIQRRIARIQDREFMTREVLPVVMQMIRQHFEFAYRAVLIGEFQDQKALDEHARQVADRAYLGTQRAELRTKTPPMDAESLERLQRWLAGLDHKAFRDLFERFLASSSGERGLDILNGGLAKYGLQPVQVAGEDWTDGLTDILILESELRNSDLTNPFRKEPHILGFNFAALYGYLLNSQFMRRRVRDLLDEPSRLDESHIFPLYALMEDLGMVGHEWAQIPLGDFIAREGKVSRITWTRLGFQANQRTKTMPKSVEVVLDREPPGLYEVDLEQVVSPPLDFPRHELSVEKLQDSLRRLQDMAWYGEAVVTRKKELEAEEVKNLMKLLEREIHILETYGIQRPPMNPESNFNNPPVNYLKSVLADLRIIYDSETGMRRSRAEARVGRDSVVVLAEELTREKPNLARVHDALRSARGEGVSYEPLTDQVRVEVRDRFRSHRTEVLSNIGSLNSWLIENAAARRVNPMALSDMFGGHAMPFMEYAQYGGEVRDLARRVNAIMWAMEQAEAGAPEFSDDTVKRAAELHEALKTALEKGSVAGFLIPEWLLSLEGQERTEAFEALIEAVRDAVLNHPNLEHVLLGTPANQAVHRELTNLFGRAGNKDFGFTDEILIGDLSRLDDLYPPDIVGIIGTDGAALMIGAIPFSLYRFGNGAEVRSRGDTKLGAKFFIAMLTALALREQVDDLIEFRNGIAYVKNQEALDVFALALHMLAQDAQAEIARRRPA